MTLNLPEKPQSVWSSIECYCLSHDFEYSQYLEIQAKYSNASPVSSQMYAELGLALFNEMTRDYD